MIKPSSIAGVLAYAGIQAGLIFVASYLDGTLYLEGEGKGFLEHYGVWAILITDALLILSVSLAHSTFRNAIASIQFSNGEDRKDRKDRKEFIGSDLKKYLDFLYLIPSSKSQYLYYFLVVIGLLSWVNNLYQTANPVLFYGNDVFDQTNYPIGFIANKINLLLSWVIIYPSCGFILLTICIETRLVLDKAKSAKGLQGNLFHPDKCYGFALLGWLNISLLTPFFIVLAAMLSLSFTHEKLYQSILLPMSLLSLGFIFISFWTVKPVVTQAQAAEESAYKKILKAINSENQEEVQKAQIARLCFATASGSPYTQFVKYALVAIRLIPVSITLTKFLLAT